MKKAEAKAGIEYFIPEWAKEAGEPWPPDGQHHYSFSTFWSWLANTHWSYTQFRAAPDARYVAEMWFDKKCRQEWRN